MDLFAQILLIVIIGGLICQALYAVEAVAKFILNRYSKK